MAYQEDPKKRISVWSHTFSVFTLQMHIRGEAGWSLQLRLCEATMVQTSRIARGQFVIVKLVNEKTLNSRT